MFPQAPSHPAVSIYIKHITLMAGKNIIDCLLKSSVFTDIDLLMIKEVTNTPAPSKNRPPKTARYNQLSPKALGKFKGLHHHITCRFRSEECRVRQLNTATR
jgi:hypothetical protein